MRRPGTSHPLLDGVDPEHIERVFARGRRSHLEPGARCIQEGDAPATFWMMLSGAARIFYVSEEGLEVTVKLLRAPAAFGELELITCHPHVENVTITEASEILALPAEDFRALMDGSPRFTRNLLEDTCARFLIAARNERALAFDSVERRIAALVMAQVRMRGGITKQAHDLHIPLSQTELALGVGATAKSVQRTVAKWRKCGILGPETRGLVLRDAEALAEIADDEALGIEWSSGSQLVSASQLSRDSVSDSALRRERCGSRA